MRTFKPAFLIAVAVICFTWLSGCTFSHTFTPQLKDNQKTVADSINAHYNFEDINVTGKSSSGTGDKHTTLSIRFVNGKNLPQGDNKQKALAKSLVMEILACVKDTAKYDSFVVEFDVRKTDGNFTSNNYVGYDFTKAELKAK